MAKSCSNISDKQADAIKKQITAGLKKLGINTGDLSAIEIEAALNRLMSEKSYTIETLLTLPHKQEIMNAIAISRQTRAEEERLLTKEH